MKRTKTLLAIAFLLAPAAACQLILGIGDDNFYSLTEGGPGTEAGVDTSIPDPCAHFRPPGRPTVPADPTSLPPLIFAFRHANFTGRGDGGIAGFDLDNECTCDMRAGTLHGGSGSCVPPPNSSRPNNCDDDGGVDNAVGHLFAGLTAPDASSDLVKLVESFNTQAKCGKQTILMALTGYNGTANDEAVTLYAFESQGIRESHGDAGEIFEPPCDPDELDSGLAMPAYPAQFDGGDKWSILLEPNLPGEVYPAGTAAVQGYVTDHVLVVDARNTGQAYPIGFGARALQATGVLVSARLVPLDAQGRVITNGDKAASFQMTDGVMAGRVSTFDLLDGVGRIVLPNASYLCDSPSFAFVRTLVCQAADTVPGTRDFQGHPCDSLSMAVQFDAVSAQLGKQFNSGKPPNVCDANALCP